VSDEIVIRRAETIDDYRACQAAQRRAWGIAEENYVVPIATMVGAQLHGGLVLGAFRPDGEAVGLSFAFLGRIEARLCLYSQLTGVVPEYQAKGLGARLKYAQRDIARSEGLGIIAWAFDPLQAGNARFNLDKLGASAGRYVENMYGLRTDDLNAGVPTDRLIVEWTTTPGPRVAISAEEARVLPHFVEAGQTGGTPEVISLDLKMHGRAVLLEVPDDINGLRKSDPALAEQWRQAVNRGFRTAFAAGYRAVGFVGEEAPRRGFYVLRQRD
jgi:predicted GNAT superfamily acetyltransferase